MAKTLLLLSLLVVCVAAEEDGINVPMFVGIFAGSFVGVVLLVGAAYMFIVRVATAEETIEDLTTVELVEAVSDKGALSTEREISDLHTLPARPVPHQFTRQRSVRKPRESNIPEGAETHVTVHTVVQNKLRQSTN
eukprot:Colp12_sorted_trinity150504_noHs@7570